MKDEEPTGTSRIQDKASECRKQDSKGDVACLIALARDENRSPTSPPHP